MKRHLLFVFSLISIFPVFFLSCKKMPNGGVPIYLKIDSVAFQAGSGQGTSSHKITDVWVTANGDQIGAFPLPAKVPVLASGDVRIVIGAGIKDNGIANTRAEYAFYNVVEQTISGAESGKVYELNPVFGYAPYARFSWMEDFESGNSITNASLAEASTTDVFEGNGCGKISLNITETDTVLIAYTTNGFQIPAVGGEVYLEMDYKCDNYFECGLITNKSGSFDNLYKITLAPKEEWNKIYINISNEVGVSRADDYRIYFKLVKFEGVDNVNVFIDNLKVVNY